MASPTFWAVYLDPLFGELRSRGVGCHIGGIFVGVVGYADDLLLLAPSRKAAQIMLSICELFAKDNNIRFSTHIEPKKSKSKCLYVTGTKSSTGIAPAPLYLRGKALPYVYRCGPLVHTLTCDGKVD